MYGFHAPQEKIEPRFWKSTQDFSDVNTGRFVRNAVLSGMTYGGNDLVPAFLKTCDAIHPLCGSEDFDGVAQSIYGSVLDSVNTSGTKAIIKSVVQPWNSSVVWAPGGTGVNSWLAVKLPEATLVERYLVASTSSTCPLSWKLQGSLDGTTWTDIHTVETTGTWTAAREEKTFTIPEATRGTYLWYRLYITASNATTMSISTLRLFRVQSLCDRGQLRIDASAANPLLLSFMNGFGVDGVTPVDYTETLSEAITTSPGYFDSYGTPITVITTPTPIDVYAKRTAGGSVSIELVVAAQSDVPYLPGRMTSYLQNGMICTTETTLTSAFHPPYTVWGGAGDTSAYLRCPQSNLKRADGEPFFVSKTYGVNYNSFGADGYINLCVEELDGSTLWLPVRCPNNYSYVTNNLNRYIKRLFVPVQSASDRASGNVIYAPKTPLRYRFSGGKMYQRDNIAGSAWSLVQKVKLGTFVANGTDFYQVQPVKPFCILAMTLSDVTNYIEE